MVIQNSPQINDWPELLLVISGYKVSQSGLAIEYGGGGFPGSQDIWTRFLDKKDNPTLECSNCSCIPLFIEYTEINSPGESLCIFCTLAAYF